eukprot:2646638-Amphidinium_carterae.1
MIVKTNGCRYGVEDLGHPSCLKKETSCVPYESLVSYRAGRMEEELVGSCLACARCRRPKACSKLSAQAHQRLSGLGWTRSFIRFSFPVILCDFNVVPVQFLSETSLHPDAAHLRLSCVTALH